MKEEVIPDCHFHRMLLQSLPFLLFPRFLALLACSGPQQDAILTPLERFMAANYALLLLFTALCVIAAVQFISYSPRYHLSWHRSSPAITAGCTTMATGHRTINCFLHSRSFHWCMGLLDSTYRFVQLNVSLSNR